MLKVNCKLKGATVHESFREEYGGQGKTVLSLGLLRKQKVQRWQRKPSSVIWQHLNDLLSLFRGMHFYTAVYADVQPWDLNTLAGCWRLISSVKIPFLLLFPLGGSLSIRTGTEVQKNKTKACTAAPGRRECERDESRKVYHEIKWWGSAAASWGRCSLYWFFQHCHLVTVTSLYERLGTKCRLWSSQYVADGWGVCVCTCVSVCVKAHGLFKDPFEEKAKVWVISYSLWETDGDAGVLIRPQYFYSMCEYSMCVSKKPWTFEIITLE